MVVYTVKLGVVGLSSSALVEKGRLHVEKLTGNPDYTLPAGFLPSLTDACDALEAANVQVMENGGKSDHLLRRQRVIDLHNLLKDAQGYVQAQSGGDLEKINGAGFQAKKRKGQPVGIPAAPGELRVLDTTLPLEFKLLWDGVPGRIYYEVWVTTGDPSLAEGWSMLTQTSKNTHLHSGLLEGKSYSYKVNAVTTAGAGATCLPVTAKAA
jgi:hypothetical protein